MLVRVPVRRRSDAGRNGWGPLLLVAVCLFITVFAEAKAVRLGGRQSISISDATPRFESALRDYDQAQKLQKSKPQEAKQLYLSAAGQWQALAAAGIENGKLEFNIGNAYLQAGDVGRAILHYRRAQRLIPGDPYLQENLKVARSRCITYIPPARRSKLLHSLFFLHFNTARSTRVWIGLTAYLLLWGVLLLGRWLPRAILLTLACACGLVAVSLGASVAFDRHQDLTSPSGVVLGTDVFVQKGPGEAYGQQYKEPLQAGVEFRLLERRQGWWHVRLPDESLGWLESSEASLVVNNLIEGT